MSNQHKEIKMRGYNTKKVISIDDDRDAPDEDVTELMAVSGSANQKSDSGLDEWLPTYQPCVYVQRYLTVAVKYQLPITTAERNAAAAACPAAPPAAA